MKTYTVILMLFMIQCSFESRQDSELSLETWRKSALEAVVTTNRLEDFQKEIMTNQINSISQDNFDKLVKKLSIKKSTNLHLIVYYSEGEVVTEWFGGVVTDNDSMIFAYLDGSDYRNDIVVKKVSDKFMSALLNNEEPGDHIILDRVIVRSWVFENGTVLSKVGTMNFD